MCGRLRFGKGFFDGDAKLVGAAKSRLWGIGNRAIKPLALAAILYEDQMENRLTLQLDHAWGQSVHEAITNDEPSGALYSDISSDTFGVF